MNPTRPLGIVALTALLALASTPAAAADAPVFHTHDLHVENSAVHGAIDLVQVSGGADGVAPGLSIQAAHADVTVYTRTAVGIPALQLLHAPSDSYEADWSKVRLDRRGDVDPGFAIVLDVTGSGWIEAREDHVEHAKGVFLSERGIDELAPGDTASAEGSDDFRDRVRDGPHGIGRIWEQAHNGTWRGDIVLELRGLDLEGTQDGKQVSLATGAERDENGVRQDVFVRMHLTGAIVSLDVPAGAVERTTFATKGAEASGGTNARIVIPRAEGEGRMLVESPFSVGITPIDGSLQVSVVPREQAPTGSILVPEAVRGPLATITLLGIAAAVAIALFLRTPRIERIESLLERGAYAAAARKAGRLARRRPDLESARISQAIALTKAGRPEAAVAAVRAFLEHRDPTDGVLQYVLGTALMEIGRKEEAQAAFEAAVARTPQLLAELGRPRGDAQAYA